MPNPDSVAAYWRNLQDRAKAFTAGRDERRRRLAELDERDERDEEDDG